MYVQQSERIMVGGVGFDPFTESDAVGYVAAAYRRGEGGVIVTPNVDIARQAARSSEAARLVGDATLVLADGMPLVWASWLAGEPLPARVAGADLIWSLSAMAAAEDRTVYLVGGGPPGVSKRAAARLVERYPALRVAGADSPPYGFDNTAGGIRTVIAPVKAAKPDLVFVGLGFPRQERLIAALWPELPSAWFVGCGAAIPFAAGAVPRAPRWMRRIGLEWLHRLGSEPRRLFKRYVLHDAPFAARLLVSAAFRH